ETIVMGSKPKVALAVALLLGGASLYLVFDGREPVPAARADGSMAAASPVAADGGGPGAGGPGAGSTADNLRTLQPQATVPIGVAGRSWSDLRIAGGVVEVSAGADAAPADEGDRREGPVVAQAVCDERGAALFAGLTAGRWHFIARKEGYCRAGRPDVLLS